LLRAVLLYVLLHEDSYKGAERLKGDMIQAVVQPPGSGRAMLECRMPCWLTRSLRRSTTIFHVMKSSKLEISSALVVVLSSYSELGVDIPSRTANFELLWSTYVMALQ
jgi:hypothetical protein